MIRVHGIPVYWGVERDAPDRSFFTRAFLNEVLPPYRESTRAIRVRISPWHWLHLGIHAYKTEVIKWGLDEVPPELIGRWGATQEDPHHGSDEAGSPDGRGPADGVGVVADELHGEDGCLPSRPGAP